MTQITTSPMKQLTSQHQILETSASRKEDGQMAKTFPQDRTTFFSPPTMHTGWNPFLLGILYQQQESGYMERILAKKTQTEPKQHLQTLFSSTAPAQIQISILPPLHINPHLIQKILEQNSIWLIEMAKCILQTRGISDQRQSSLKHQLQ